MSLFVLPYSEGIPYYLAESPAGKDAGATVDYAWVVKTAPIGDRHATSLMRRVALGLRGTGVFELDFYVDGKLEETHKVYMQAAEPSSPAVDNWWVDLTQSPFVLKRVISTSPTVWRVWPDRERSADEERNPELPVAAKGRTGYIAIRSISLEGDLSIGAWAIGARPL